MRKIIIAVTGASGSVLADLLLKKLSLLNNKEFLIDVVFSDTSRIVWNHEIGTFDEKSIPFRIYKPDDFMAPFASGSSLYETMIVCPCSMGTLGRIAAGISNDLITRAADVMLKERRKLILVLRETPYNLIHIRNMETVTLAGAIVCPATPSFYHKPETIHDMLDTVISRILDLAGIGNNAKRWGD